MLRGHFFRSTLGCDGWLTGRFLGWVFCLEVHFGEGGSLRGAFLGVVFCLEVHLGAGRLAQGCVFAGGFA